MESILRDIGKEAIRFLNELKGKEGIDKVIGKHGDDTTRVVDKKSEDYIFELLRNTGYKFLFVSEESGTTKENNYDYIAVIDPLDGSTNFINDIPWSSVSIALYKKEEKNFIKSCAGVVANIFSKEIYTYYNGKSYINGNVIENIIPKSNIILAYFGKKEIDKAYQILKKLEGFKIRTLGSASLDMILVCTGKAYFYFDIRDKIRNVDVAASTGFCSSLKIYPFNSKNEIISSSLNSVDIIGEIMLTYDEELKKRLFL